MRALDVCKVWQGASRAAAAETFQGCLKPSVRNPQSATRNPQSATRNPQPAIRNPQSAIRNPQSAIRNSQSAVRSPQSAVRSPQSAVPQSRSPKPEARSPKPEARSPKPEARSPVPLQKQEQIKGPKNGSIARFDRLGCYRSGSEIGDGFRVRAAAGFAGNALAGFGRVKGMTQAGLRQCRFGAARLKPKLQPSAHNPKPEIRSLKPGSAAKTGANKRPRKRLYRTVLGALPLSKR